MKSLVICALLLQGAAPRRVPWEVYEVSLVSDRFAVAYNECMVDYFDGKLNLKACKAMHDRWAELNRLQGFPRKTKDRK